MRIGVVLLICAMFACGGFGTHSVEGQEIIPASGHGAIHELDQLSLHIGDKAPALSIAKWVKGSPVKTFEPGKVYLVEFWATWCSPCRKSLPRLTDLQARRKDQGVTVIGVSSQERRGLADIEPFVAKQGDRMIFSVAWDDQGHTSKDWLEAAGIDGIPAAFIINQDGRVAWSGVGFPMRGLDAALDQILAKTFDLEAAATEARRRAAIEAQARPFLRAAEEGYGAGEFTKTLDNLDKAIALDPPSMGEMVYRKVQLLAGEMKEPDKAFAFAAEQVSGPQKSNPGVLNAIAWYILDDPALEKRDPALALRAAERAAELTENKDAAVLDTLARALFETGARARALDIQAKAIELADDEDLRSELKTRLEQYQARMKKN